MSEKKRSELVEFLERTSDRFEKCSNDFEEFENSVVVINENVQKHQFGVQSLEGWLRRSEEVIVTEPKWKIQV